MQALLFEDWNVRSQKLILFERTCEGKIFYLLPILSETALNSMEQKHVFEEVLPLYVSVRSNDNKPKYWTILLFSVDLSSKRYSIFLLKMKVF